MKVTCIFISLAALLVVCVTAAPAETTSDHSSIIQEITNILKEEGTAAAKKLVQDLLVGAKGAMKELLLDLMKQIIILELEGKIKVDHEQYLVDFEAIKAILNELAEHGKQAAIELARKILAEAQGTLKDLIIRLLEMLERSNDAYILDIIGIDTSAIKAILKELADHGKQAAIELGQKILEEAKGALRDLIIRLIESIQGQNQAQIIGIIHHIDLDRIVGIINTLVKYGKQSAIRFVQSIRESTQGHMRELVDKLLEILNGQGDAYSYNDLIRIHLELIARLLKARIEESKQEAIEKAREIIQQVKGSFRELFEIVLRWLQRS